MSDYTELKRLAEAATQCSGPRRVETDYNGVYQVVGDGGWKILNAWHTPDGKGLENAQFTAAASPTAVLALIAQNDQLKKDRRTEHQSLRSDKARNSLYMMIATSLIDDHPYERTGSDWDYEHPIHDKIISLLAERDQLKAENEALRKDAERYQFLRNDISNPVQDFCIVKKYWGGTFPDRILEMEGADAEIDAAMGKGEQS